MKFLPIILVAAGVVASFVTLQNQVAGASERLVKVEDQQRADDKTNTQILVELSGIRSDLTWIKSSLANKQ